MNTTHKIDPENLCNHTIAYAEGIIQALEGLVGIQFQPAGKPHEIIKPEADACRVHASIAFHGVIQGEFLLSMTEEAAAGLIGIKLQASIEEQFEFKEEFEKLAGEALNIATEAAIGSLRDEWGELIFLPPKVIYGTIHYPAAPITSVAVKIKPGPLECRMVLNRTDFKAAREVEAGQDRNREELAAKDRILRKANKKLDRMMAMLPELNRMAEELFSIQNVIHQSFLQGGESGAAHRQYYSRLSDISRKIRHLLTRMWSVPLKITFEKATALAREYAETSEKNIRFSIEDEGVQIDRQSDDIIRQVLEDIMCNAIEFGIEPPETRTSLDKTEHGNLFLKGYIENGTIIIEAGDDGRGMNRERLLNIAKHSGILRKEPNISMHRLTQLIFWKSPDGKIVGSHHKVHLLMKKIGGRIIAQTEPEKGSRFFIQIPITMSSAEGIVTSFSGKNYIIPITNIRETVQPKQSDCFTIEQKGEMIRLRNRLFPLIRLDRIWGMEKVDTPPWEALAVIVESGGLSACILVDEVIGKQNVVIQNLGEGQWISSECIMGGSIMPDGRVGLVLDVRKLLSLNTGNRAG